MRPAAASPARNSSNSKAREASASASTPGSIDGNSSLSVNRQDGSSPTTGTPRARAGPAAASSRRASARASSTRPADRKRTPAAQGARAVGGERAQLADAVAEPAEHLDGGLQVLRLEVAVEGIGEKENLADPLSPYLFRPGRGLG